MMTRETHTNSPMAWVATRWTPVLVAGVVCLLLAGLGPASSWGQGPETVVDSESDAGSFLKQAPSDPKALKISAEDGLGGAERRIRGFYGKMLRETQSRLGFSYPQTLKVQLYRDHEAFNAAIQAAGGQARPPHIAAVAFGFQDLIILKSRAWTSNHRESLETIFQHELVHCFLGHLMRVRPRCGIPTWLNEGLAQWVSQSVLGGDNRVLEQARASGSLIPLKELERNFPDQEGASQLAYAQSLSLVRFIAEHDRGARNIPDLLKLLSRGFDLDFALKAVIGLDRRELESSWRSGQRRWLGLPLGRLLEFGFAIFVGIVTLLLIAMRWSKRRRLNAQLDAEDVRANQNDALDQVTGEETS